MNLVGYTHNMQVLHSDKRRRITFPVPAEPGDLWISEVVSPNQILLTKVEQPKPGKVKLVSEDGVLVAVGKRQISWEETRKAIDEFP